ncbi:MAG: thiamine pyrophosphate-dependent dehydrogenase E1 component subunit alpha [Elusimicrobiota bacterium]
MPQSHEALGRPLLLKIHSLMVRARVLEERCIKMGRTGEGYFWIGGPGEEAFNVSLGLQIKKGSGPKYDYLNFHYRNSATMLAMGASMIDTLRQMRTVATDPYTKGRNFVNHYSAPEWNVVPVTSTIETQYSTAIGTAIANARTPGDAVTIVTGGDGGTAEGDFHSCLVWANRPVLPLPILITVVNNHYAISVPEETQHGERKISDWGKVFGMPAKTVDGNDVAEAYSAIREALAYCRKERKPYLLEAVCSRLYGHSSASGANRINEPDCIALLEERMIALGFATKDDLQKTWSESTAELDAAHQQVKQEPYPDPSSIWDGMFSGPLPASYPTKGGS